MEPSACIIRTNTDSTTPRQISDLDANKGAKNQMLAYSPAVTTSLQVWRRLTWAMSQHAVAAPACWQLDAGWAACLRARTQLVCVSAVGAPWVHSVAAVGATRVHNGGPVSGATHTDDAGLFDTHRPISYRYRPISEYIGIREGVTAEEGVTVI